jgi:hypothetical protein
LTPTPLFELDTQTTLRVRSPIGSRKNCGYIGSGEQPLSAVCSASVISVGLRAYSLVAAAPSPLPEGEGLPRHVTLSSENSVS